MRWIGKSAGEKGGGNLRLFSHLRPKEKRGHDGRLELQGKLLRPGDVMT